MRDLVRREW